MKKRCLGFFPSGSLCRYIRWFFHFYKNPFIASRWLKRKEVLDTVAVFVISLLASSLLLAVLILVFISGNIFLIDVVHPFFGMLLMFQSALVYGVVFGGALQVVSTSVTLRFFLQIILQALRLYAVMMPLLVTLFFIVLAMMLNDFLQTQTPPALYALAIVAIVWLLWLQYTVILRPVAAYLNAIFSRRKSMLMACGALVLTLMTLQLATVSYEERLFEKKRFLSAAVGALYMDGRIDAGQRAAYEEQIAKSQLFGRPPAQQ